MSFVEVQDKKKVMLKKENKIFSKQFVTTERTKYGLKFSVLSIIINERKLIKKCLSLKFKTKNVILKKEKKIFSKQFVTTERTKYGLIKKAF